MFRTCIILKMIFIRQYYILLALDKIHKYLWTPALEQKKKNIGDIKTLKRYINNKNSNNSCNRER